jgi:hypothetical protein
MRCARTPQDLHIHTTWSRGDDAHQPDWLYRTVARYAAAEPGIEEVLLFPSRATEPVVR